MTPLPLAIGKFSGQLQGAGSYSNPALGQQGGCSHEAVLVVLAALGHSARTHKRGQVPKCGGSTVGVTRAMRPLLPET